MFDTNYVRKAAGAVQVPQAAGFEEPQRGSGYTNNNLLKFGNEIQVSQTGYLYIWVSNESENTEVWFDDLNVIHQKTLVAEATDYGVWGDVMREQKWEDLEGKYRWGYQGQYSERDQETNWNHFQLREWDAQIGRWVTTDPKRQHNSGYLGMGNNPISKIDSDGGFSRFVSWLKSLFIPGATNYYHALEGEWAVGWNTQKKVEGGYTTEHHYIIEGGPGFERSLLPDVVTFEMNYNAFVGAGGSQNYTWALITSGPDWGLHTYKTSSTSAGAYFGASFNSSFGWYSGNPKNMTRSTLLGPTRSVGADFGFGASVFGSYQNWNQPVLRPTVSGLSFGVGANIGAGYSEGETREFKPLTINGWDPQRSNAPLHNWLGGRGYRP